MTSVRTVQGVTVATVGPPVRSPEENGGVVGPVHGREEVKLSHGSRDSCGGGDQMKGGETEAGNTVEL